MNENKQLMPWYRQIAAVMLRDVYLKAIGTPIFIGLFFGAYFYLLNNPVYPVTVMPMTSLDRLIGFHPLTLFLYLSLWVYVSLPPALLATRRELYAYVKAMAWMCLAALIVFYFWPTAVPVANVDWAEYPGVAFLKSMDASGNAFPSLHVATAIFSGIWLHHLLRRFATPPWVLLVNWVWCIAIVYSTLATRQHVVVDVLAGIMLGALAAIVSLRPRAYGTTND
ncbi:MAG: hypothetical protein AUJ58_04050 [Zetaproteobacteria bacterium CG1_02_55_237]|nr:MAG: hypothetical protein AUJ58_04050 [Zetaproteobacteria bacterium CG1_02_55_237]